MATPNADHIKSLLVPTNPNYHWDVDPESQPEFANPVTVNNHVLRLANAGIAMAVASAKVNKQLSQAKQALKDAEHALEDFEQDLLRTSPPNTAAQKSNRLLALYVRQVAFEHGRQAEHQQLLQAQRAAQGTVDQLEIEKDTIWATSQAIKLAGEHIQTHLSFRKFEANFAR